MRKRGTSNKIPRLRIGYEKQSAFTLLFAALPYNENWIANE